MLEQRFGSGIDRGELVSNALSDGARLRHFGERTDPSFESDED